MLTVSERNEEAKHEPPSLEAIDEDAGFLSCLEQTKDAKIDGAFNTSKEDETLAAVKKDTNA